MTQSPFVKQEIMRGRRGTRALEDAVVTPRCPACRAWLIARIGRSGPYFQCQCPRRPAPTLARPRAA